MPQEALLDISALREKTEGSPMVQQRLLLLYVETARQCLERMQGLVVHSSNAKWKAVLLDLRAASLRVHATQLAMLCGNALDRGDETVSQKTTTYLQIRGAYEALVAYMKNAHLLSPVGQCRSQGDGGAQ